MLEDDHVDFPMSFFLRFEVQVPLCASCLQSAVEASKDQHPLFFATTVGRRGRFYWHLDSVAPTVSLHDSGGFASSREDWKIDLAIESGLRLSIGDGASGNELWLQVHHCCSDARGVLDFTRDVLEIYALNNCTHKKQCHGKETVGVAAAAEATGYEEVTSRKTGFSKSIGPYLRPVSTHWKRIWAYYGHKFHSIVSPARPPQSGNKPFQPSYLTTRIPFSGAAWGARRAGISDVATLNDGLLQSTFRGLNRHFRRASEQFNGWLRIAVPIDQRISHGECSTAVNRSSMVFVDRNSEQVVDRRGLLPSLSSEMRTVSRDELSCALNDVLRVLDQLPSVMRLATSDKRCAATGVVSNLGNLSDGLTRLVSSRVPEPASHPLLGDEMDFLVPLRAGTHVSFGVATYRGHIHLCLHYDARRISEHDARRILYDTSNDLSEFLDSSSTLSPATSAAPAVNPL